MVDNRKFIEEFMEVTNVYRKRHQVDDLALNDEISKISQAWAKKLTNSKSISHSPNPTYRGEILGENIAMRFSTEQDYYSGHRAVGQWYQEIATYSFKTHSGPATGHFTQLVWKGSKEVGVGRAQAKDGRWIVVANYYPAGNFIGRFDANVLPPINGNTSLVASPDDISQEPAKGKELKKTETISTKTTRKLIKSGNEYKMEETVTTTRTDAAGKATKTTQKVTRAPTKEEIEKFKM